MAGAGTTRKIVQHGIIAAVLLQSENGADIRCSAVLSDSIKDPVSPQKQRSAWLPAIGRSACESVQRWKTAPIFVDPEHLPVWYGCDTGASAVKSAITSLQQRGIGEV